MNLENSIVRDALESAAAQAQFDYQDKGQRTNPFEYLSLAWREYETHYNCLVGIRGGYANEA